MQSESKETQPEQGGAAQPENILTSEATLVPFPPGEYRIAIGGMEHPSKPLTGDLFPAVQITVLPSSRRTARLAPGDGANAWLQRAGEEVRLAVMAPGAAVIFTTYRPNEYATTGIRLDIERHTAPNAASQPAPQPPHFQAARQPAGFPQPPQPRQEMPQFTPQSMGSLPGFPQPQQLRPEMPQFAPQPPMAHQPDFPQQQPVFPAPGFPGGQGLGFAPQQPFGAPAPQPWPAAGQQPPFASFGGQPGPFQQPAQPRFAAQPTPAMPSQPGPGFNPAAGFTRQAAPRPFSPPSQPAQPTPPQAGPDAAGPLIRMAGHIENEGDVAAEPGRGLGGNGSKRRLEAVALYAEGVNLHEMEYAAVSYDGRLMPWVSPPQFTGTRGMGAPLLGFAARLGGDAAERFDIVYSGSFFAAGPVAPARNGEFLKSPNQGDPLEQLHVRLEPKA